MNEFATWLGYAAIISVLLAITVSATVMVVWQLLKGWSEWRWVFAFAMWRLKHYRTAERALITAMLSDFQRTNFGKDLYVVQRNSGKTECWREGYEEPEIEYYEKFLAWKLQPDTVLLSSDSACDGDTADAAIRGAIVVTYAKGIEKTQLTVDPDCLQFDSAQV